MAALEDLIKQIADSRLRDALAAEVAKLKASKKFGLVFEEHLPEMVRLPGLPIKVGVRVLKKDDPGMTPYRVVAEVNGKRVKIVPEARTRAGVVRGLPAEVLESAETVERAAVVVAKACGEPMYPALVPVDAIERAPGKPWHVLINADNYHALQLLLYGYEGKVDVIYIDPPYNTGARDWKYNNDYVDDTDRFRHSKWLSFMKKRLELAKRLLDPACGTIVVTIDEHEVHHLGVLLAEVFPEHFRQMVTIVINQKGVAQGRLSRAEEYAMFCFSSGASVFPQEDDLLSPDREASKRFATPRWEWLLRGGTNSRREDRPKLFYPIFVDPARQVITGVGEPLESGKQPAVPRGQERKIAWPIRTDGSHGNWRVSPSTLMQLVGKGYAKLGGFDEDRGTWTVLYLGQRVQDQIEDGDVKIVGRDMITGAVDLAFTAGQRRQIKTVWHRASHDAGNYGSSLLRNLLGESAAFAFPKSLYAVADTLRLLTAQRRNAVILDFFAGSGTTLHATAMLNAEDGGERRCLLVTNNEVGEERERALVKAGFSPGDEQWTRDGIAHSVTWPRICAAVSGIRPDGEKVPGSYIGGADIGEGLAANAAFFSLDFLDPTEVSRGDKFEAIAPILWMLAGCRGPCDTSRGSGKWYIPKGNPFAVLLNEDHFGEFQAKLEERPDIDHIFLVTDSTAAFNEMRAELARRYTCIQLYRSYLDTFRINLTEPDSVTSGTGQGEATFSAGRA